MILISLRSEHIIEGVRGHPFVVSIRSDSAVGEDTTTDSVYSWSRIEPDVRQKYQRIALCLESDILRATFPAGEPLPGIKELRKRYGCSYPTIKKVLCELQKKGLIMPGYGGYAVTSFRVTSSYSRVVFIGYSWEVNELVLSPGEEEFLRLFEQACRKANLQLDVVHFSAQKDGISFADAAGGMAYNIHNTEGVFGYIYLLTGKGSFRREVLETLIPKKKPIAVIDEWQQLVLPFPYLGSRTIKVFRAATSLRAPALVARYILGRGHRHVAYFSPFHKTAWSRARLETMRTILEKAGKDVSLYQLVIEEYSTPSDFLPCAKQRCDVSTLVREYETLRKALPFAFTEPVNALTFYDNLQTILARCEVSLQCEDLFTKALQDSRITAWICVNDYTALMALKFLKRHNVKVPAEISVIGFDDTHEAMKRGLTSYNFNYAGLVNMVLNFILQGGRSLPSRLQTIEVEGFLSERHSSGAARKRHS